MKIWHKEEISISGKSRNPCVFLKMGTEKPLQILPYADGSFYTRGGEAMQRHALKQYCKEEFGTEKPDFALLFERVKALNPKPVNPKAPAWLK